MLDKRFQVREKEVRSREAAWTSSPKWVGTANAIGWRVGSYIIRHLAGRYLPVPSSCICQPFFLALRLTLRETGLSQF